MPTQLASATKGALVILSLFVGAIVISLLAFTFFLTVTTTVYAAVASSHPKTQLALTVQDVLSFISTPKVLENMNAGNVALAGVFVLLVVLIAVLDSALTEATERLRQKAKLPLVDTIAHYNQNSYDIAIARASSATYPRMKQD